MPSNRRVHPRPVRWGKRRRVMAVDEVDRCCSCLGHERRPLEGALPAAHNQTALVPKCREIHHVARMLRAPVRQHARKIVGNVLERLEPHREEHVAGDDRSTIGKRCPKRPGPPSSIASMRSTRTGRQSICLRR